MGAAYFARPLFFGWTFYFRDLHQFFLPVKELTAQLWRRGIVPLWNPYLHGGMPLLGDPLAAGFYPTSVLYLVMPAVRALNLELAGHVVLAALAAYALARELRLHRAGAWTAAVAYGFAGITLAQLNLYGRLLAMPFLPLVLLGLHRHARGSRRWLLLAAAGAGVQIVAGAPEIAAVTWVTAFVWVTAFPYRQALARRWAAVATVAGLGTLVAAAHLLPLLDLLRGSRRGGGLPFAAFAQWSVPWRRLPELVVPGYLGALDALDPRRYWGAAIVDQGFPYQPSLYLGLTTVVLATAALASHSQGAIPRRARVVLALLAVGAVALALGRHLPGFELLYRALPPLRLFRYPEKLVVMAALPIALLAGWSVHRLARGHGGGVRRATAATAAIAALVAASLALLAVNAGARHSLALMLLSRTEPAAAAHLARAFLQAALLAAAVALVLWLGRVAPRRAGWWIAALVTVDLLAAGRAVNPVTPARWFLAAPPALAEVRKVVASGRLYVAPRREQLDAPPDADAAWGYRRDRWVLADYLAAAYGIRVIFHEDFHSLSPPRTVRLGAMLARLPADRRLPLLSASAVRAVLAPFGSAPRGLRPAAMVPDPAGPPLLVSRNDGAVERYRWVGAWREVPGPEQAVRAMLAPGYDPRRHTVLESRAESPPPAPCPEPATLRVAEPTPNRAVVRLRSACPGWLVVADSWASGWRYTLDGRAIAPAHADVAFAAVAVPPGAHRIERVYRPLPLYAGVAVSALALLAMVPPLLWWRSPAAARRRPARSPAASCRAPSASGDAPRP
jgi:hypothetical protein